MGEWGNGGMDEWGNGRMGGWRCHAERVNESKLAAARTQRSILHYVQDKFSRGKRLFAGFSPQRPTREQPAQNLP
jgi:hypothetical protein